MIHHISDSPLLALKVMVLQLAISLAVYEFQLPIIVMQLFQLLAFASTITIGIITIYKFIKKIK
jgi:hypothetical protein